MKYQKIAIITGLIVVVTGGLAVLWTETRFMASFTVLRNKGDNAVCSEQLYTGSGSGIYCVRITEVQRFLDRGSRIAEYDIAVYNTAAKDKSRAVNRQNIFGAYHGRIDPGTYPPVTWEEDGLHITNVHEFFLPAEEIN